VHSQRPASVPLTLIGLLFFGYTQAAMAGTAAITGTIPRGTPTSFNITVTFTGVAQADHDKTPATSGDRLADLDNRVQIQLTDIDATNDVHFKASEAVAPLLFYASESQPALEGIVETGSPPAPNQVYDYTYYLTITETQSGYLASKIVGGKLNIAASLNLIDRNTSSAKTSAPLPISQASYVITEAPTFDATAPIVGSMKSLTIKWNPATSINSTTGAQTSTTMNVYVINKSVTTLDLPTKKFSGSATTPDTGAPVPDRYQQPVAFNANSPWCGTKGDPQNYIDSSQFANGVAGVTYVSANVSAGQVTVSRLDNNTQYVVFLQYEPSGTAYSSCLVGQPSPNFTLTELNGEGDASVVDFRCFIATAAYGTPFHKDLHFFRKFRERILLKSWFGRRFVHYYYKFSPPLADFIADHPRLRRLTRGMLAVPAVLLKSVDEYY